MQNIIFNIEQVRVADRILGLQQTRQLFTDVNISWPIAAQALLTQQGTLMASGSSDLVIDNSFSR